MLQVLAQPYSATVLMAVALVAVSVFTAAKVLATVPASSLDVLHYKAPGAAVQEYHKGVIAWVNASAIRITDTFGVTRVFTIDKSTAILIGDSPESTGQYTDLRVLDHVRISVLKDNTDIRAQVITVL